MTETTINQSEREKVAKKTKWIIFLIGLAGNLAWAVENQFYNVYMYNKISPTPIYISIMVAASAITAGVTAIIMGAVSDIKGKRRPFMLFGFILWGVTTAIYPLAGAFRPVVLAVAIAIIFDCIMTYFGSTAFDAVFNGYFTDITTEFNRGKALGVLQTTMLLSTLVIYGISGFIIEGFESTIGFGYEIFFIIMGGFAFLGVIGAYISEEPADLKPSGKSLKHHVKKLFRKDMIKDNKDCFLILIGMLIWATAFYIFFPFVLVYLQHYLGLALSTSSIIVFIGFIICVILAYPLGIYLDKIGRKKITIICVVGDALSLFLFIISANFLILIIAAVLMQFFMTGWNMGANAWMRDLFPASQTAEFSGYYTVFAATLPMVIGSPIGGLLASISGQTVLIDGIPGYVPTPLIFIVAAIIMIPAIIPLLFAKETKGHLVSKSATIKKPI
jgi:MFS family permease